MRGHQLNDAGAGDSAVDADDVRIGSPASVPTSAAMPPRAWFGLKPAEALAMIAVSVALLLASYLQWWPIDVVETWGFVTGGICVWLVVREHLWNWPIGLANNILFFVLFLRGRLYADMTLQVVYFALGIYGWLNWRLGGENRTILQVSRTTKAEWIVLAVAMPLSTLALRQTLVALGGAAPLAGC